MRDPVDTHPSAVLPHTLQGQRLRVLATLLLASLGTLFVVALGAWFVLEQILSDKVEEHLITVVKDHAAAIELFVDERLMALTLVAQLHSRDELTDPAKLQRVLDDLNSAYAASYQDLGVIDQEGQHLAYAGPYDLLGKNYRHTPWFENVCQSDHHVSEVFLGYRNIPHFIVAVRRDEPGGGFWILRASINSDLFEKVVSRGRMGATGDCFVVDRSGRYQTPPKTGARLLDSSLMPMPELTSEVVIRSADEASGQEITRTMKWIKQNQWLLVVQQENEETRAPIYRARREGLAVLAVGVGVITITMLWTTRKLFSRLARTQSQKEALDRQLLQAGKLATIGEMTTGVAHEINNPLAIILSEQTNIDDLLKELPTDERLTEMKASVDQTRKQVLRCKTITQKMLQFGRQQSSDGKRIDLARELTEIIRLIAHQAEIANADLCLEIEPDIPWIHIDPSELQQVITNLINNALQAMGRGGGGILVSAWRQQQAVVIMVEDTGPGIPPENHDRIFEPFFTTKPVGKGTGLGLSVCYGIVTKWRGVIHYESQTGRGAAFYLTFPETAKETAA